MYGITFFICLLVLCLLNMVACQPFEAEGLSGDKEYYSNAAAPSLDTLCHDEVDQSDDLRGIKDPSEQTSGKTETPTKSNGTESDKLPALVCVSIIQTCPDCQANESGGRCFLRRGIAVALVVIPILALIALCGCYFYHKAFMKEVRKLSKTLMKKFGYTRTQANETELQEKDGFIPAV